MNKEILGYEAPSDFYGGFIQKGDTIIQCANKVMYKSLNKTSYNADISHLLIPAEIAETWKPVYKKQEWKPNQWIYGIWGAKFAIEKIKNIAKELYDTHLTYYPQTNTFSETAAPVSLNNIIRLATKEEVLTTLEEVAKRKGLIPGAKIKGIITNLTIPHNEEYYLSKEGNLCLDGLMLFDNETNTWAEIVVDEKILIGGKEVKYLGKTCIEINGFQYHIDILKTLLDTIKYGEVKSFNVGCDGQYIVDEKLLIKIINKLSE